MENTSRNKIRVLGHQSTELYPHILGAKKYREAVVKSIFKEMIKTVSGEPSVGRDYCVLYHSDAFHGIFGGQHE